MSQIPAIKDMRPRVSVPRQRSSRDRYFNVIFALMMHDIKNRFFGSGLGQIVMIFWPFAHIVILIVIYTVTGRPHPYGDSIIQYSAVSIFPFITFIYVTRWIIYSAQQNKSFLQYPIIQPLDILIARTVLETVNITIVAFMLILFVMCAGYDAMPSDPTQATYAALATLFLAIGFGFLNAPFAFFIPLWILVVALLIIVMYISSGVLFVASSMPESIRVPLSYNPLLHCVEWMRSAYYPDYPTLVLSKNYVLEFALTSLTAGLLLLKALRRLF